MQIQPCGPLRGELTVPGDKSISHRAVMLGALASGTTHITGFLMGEDCLSTIDCFRKMGVEIEITDKEVIVEGVGLHGLCAPEETLYCFATTSDSWNGIRVRVILDGREQEVRKLTSIGDRLYSTEETYIGRDRLEGSGT